MIQFIRYQENIQPAELIAANNLSTTILIVGQKLAIPLQKNTTTYIVQKGDTLYSIANKFNTTVSQIKNLNNLLGNNLTIGQNLKIS